MKRRLWMGATAFAVAVVIWPLGSWAASTAATQRSIGRSSPSPGHLYVLEHAYKAVFRFPLAQDGLPAKNPDSVLYLEGANYPEGLAVDKTGNMFVADPIGWGSAVAEFAAGSTGHQFPISILFAYGPDRLALDAAERLYVHYNGNQAIAIFAKGARGNDAPVGVIPPIYKFEGATDFLVGKSGALYIDIQGGPGPIAIYNNPLKSSPSPDLLLLPQGGFEFFWGQTFTVDAETNHLFTQFEVIYPKYWNKVNYGIRPASGMSIAIDPKIFTGDCGGPGNSIVGGTLVIKRYLIVSCGSNGVVLVYMKDQLGRQNTPFEIVGQGTLHSPMQIAVGP